jgi:hypothetical protein
VSIAVCEGSETPEANSCVYQTSLQPVSVRVVGDAVFGEIPAGPFVTVALAVYGLSVVTRSLGELSSVFRIKR